MIVWALGFVVLAGASNAAAPISTDLALKVKEPGAQVFLGDPKYIALQEAVPANVSTLPTLEFAHPRFGSAALGPETKIALAMDFSPNLTGDKRAILNFDSNHDGDLSNDPKLLPVAPTPSNDREYGVNHVTFQTAHTFIAAADRNINLEFVFFGSPEHPNLVVRTADYGTGTLHIGQFVARVTSVDNNLNGRFGDVSVLKNDEPLGVISQRRGDLLRIETLDPTMTAKVSAYDQVWQVGKYISLQGSAYALTISPLGDKLTLSPPETACGRFSFPSATHDALLINGDGYLDLRGPGYEMVPFGDYRLLRLVFGETDAMGNKWECSTWPSGKEWRIAVKTGHKKPFPFGPPFRVAVQAQAGDKSLRMRVRMVGTAGEEYGWQDVRCNGKPVIPSVSVRTRAGKELYRAEAYSIGTDYVHDGCDWNFPQDVREITIVPIVDLGPFKMQTESLRCTLLED